MDHKIIKGGISSIGEEFDAYFEKGDLCRKLGDDAPDSCSWVETLHPERVEANMMMPSLDSSDEFIDEFIKWLKGHAPSYEGYIADVIEERRQRRKK